MNKKLTYPIYFCFDCEKILIEPLDTDCLKFHSPDVVENDEELKVFLESEPEWKEDWNDFINLKTS